MAELKSIALLPLASVYGALTAVRNSLYDRGIFRQTRAALPVISVGNIVVGGSGKSPVVQMIVRLLLERGERPVILLRGYGGRESGPREVEMSDNAALVGDEAIMHRLAFAGALPVVIARSRVAGVRFIESRQLGTVVVLDDGFQHRALKRDLDLLVVDVSDDAKREIWRSGRMLPAGPLREAKQAALRRVDEVIFVARGAADADVFRRLGGAALKFQSDREVRCVIRPSCFRDIVSGETRALELFSGKSAIATAAIGSPAQFFSMLESLGVTLTDRFPYPDHHRYSAADWSRLARACAGGLPVFVTAKDAVKLRDFVRTPGQVFVLEIEAMAFDRSDKERLVRRLDSVCGAPSANRSSGISARQIASS